MWSGGRGGNCIDVSGKFTVGVGNVEEKVRTLKVEVGSVEMEVGCIAVKMGRVEVKVRSVDVKVGNRQGGNEKC